MTAETLAAAILRDVPRINGDRHFLVSEVLAALSRAMSDDLAERAAFHLLVLRDDLGQWSKQSADMLTALIAQNAALRAERDAANALLRDAVSKIQSLYDGIAPLGEGRFAEADETVQAARAHLGAKP